MDITKSKKRFEQKIAAQQEGEGRALVKSRQPQTDLFDDGRVRPEINFSKYADRIFLAPQSKKLRDSRTVKWQPTLFDQSNDSHPAELLIEPIQGGKTGSTTTYKIWLGLIRLWELRGKPTDGRVVFSARELAEVLSMKWGGATAKRIRRELKTLKSVLYTWKWSFTDEEGNPLRLVDEMNILARSTYIDDDLRLKGEKFEALNAVEFDSLIVKNLLAGRTKPVELETFISIPNGAAAALYMRLDIILSRNSYYERTAANVLADLEIVGGKYGQRNHRKTKLKELIKTLDGKELSTGKLSLTIEETADKADWKLIARKTPRKKPKNRVGKGVSNPKELRDDLAAHILAAVGQESRRRLWELFAGVYPDHLIRQAVSEFKADRSDDVKSDGKFFVVIVHRLAHLHNLEWIKPCGDDCKWRKGNQLISK